MRIATGKVVAGKVVVDGLPLEEGATVTVIAAEDTESFELSSAEGAALLASIVEADGGDLVDADEVVAELGRSG
jgi:hypothetical protein